MPISLPAVSNGPLPFSLARLLVEGAHQTMLVDRLVDRVAFELGQFALASLGTHQRPSIIA